MRWLLIFSVISGPITVQADWGSGVWGATNCNQQYEPAPQAHSANDEISNLRGQMNQDNRSVRDLETQLNGISPRIDSARDKMAKVISSQGLAAIEEHYNQRREHTAYRKACGPRAGGDANLVPIPEGFCYHTPASNGADEQYTDLWDRMADKHQAGRVIDNICRFHVPPQPQAPAQDEQDMCVQGLSDYYAAMDERARLTQEIADMRSRVQGHESRIGRINLEVSEGRYCATCYSERRGYSTNSTGDQVMDMVMPLMAVGAAMLSNSQRQRRVSAPAMAMPYRAYPARPYAAPVPGYYGVHNGHYGSVPGGIGRGAFGCNNTSPLAFGDGTFGNDIMPIFNGPSPINSPFSAPFRNPVATNRLFNSGFGPGIMPFLGGRGPGMGGPRGFNRNAPAMLRPIQSRGPITQMPQRLGRPGFGFGNLPTTLPFQRGGVAQQPPAVLGFQGGPSTNILGNYVNQMNQISQNIQRLGGGTYYAPPTLPYVTGGGGLSAPNLLSPGGGNVAPPMPTVPTVPTAPTAPTGPGVVTPVKKK